MHTAARFTLTLVVGLALAMVARPDRAAAQGPDKKDPPKTDEVKPIIIKGELTDDDPRDAVKVDCAHKVHVVKLLASQNYQIDMIKKDEKVDLATGKRSMDPYLRIEDAKLNRLAEDDDSAGDYNARILFTPPKDGDYRLIATCLFGTGEYTLKITAVSIPKVQIYEFKNGLITIQNQLAANDNRDEVRQQMFAKVFHIKMIKGKTYTIDMVAQLDSYLRLEDGNKKQLAEDDDGGGFPNARIVIQAPDSGIYRVIATSFPPGATGPFTLTIREQ